jgi:hypothetical protein
MPRGTKKRYFKKKKTRNIKNTRKQQRLKHGNKTRKRKQTKKKGGVRYKNLPPGSKAYLKQKYTFIDNDKVEEEIKHHLANLEPTHSAYRPRGLRTTFMHKWNSKSSRNDGQATLYTKLKDDELREIILDARRNDEPNISAEAVLGSRLKARNKKKQVDTRSKWIV